LGVESCGEGGGGIEEWMKETLVEEVVMDLETP
jgi:hypothetical protein